MLVSWFSHSSFTFIFRPQHSNAGKILPSLPFIYSSVFDIDSLALFPLNNVWYIPAPGGSGDQEFLDLMIRSPQPGLCAPWTCSHHRCGTFSPSVCSAFRCILCLFCPQLSICHISKDPWCLPHSGRWSRSWLEGDDYSSVTLSFSVVRTRESVHA